jgi:transposase-like protein
MARAKQPRPIPQMSVAQWEAAFPDEAACDAYLTKVRWPNGVSCPRCGNTEVYALPSRPGHWQCHACATSGYRFSTITGTIFENTNKDLRDWFRVIHLMLTAKKGISALQIQRYMGFGSYKTAWYMCHRVRTALQDNEFQKLAGMVEMDETFIGGKAANKHRSKKRDDNDPKSGPGGKTPIIGAISRSKKTVVARVIDAVTAKAVARFVGEVVEPKVSVLNIDSARYYMSIPTAWQRRKVDHHAGEYVRNDEMFGAIHTNTIEGFWSLVKRGIVGNYHRVSKKYLPLYVAEFCFRYNNRENADIFGAAIAGC